MHDMSTFLRKMVKITGVSIPMATSVLLVIMLLLFEFVSTILPSINIQPKHDLVLMKRCKTCFYENIFKPLEYSHLYIFQLKN